jgi:mono/diheme cytochrome c family protein
MCEDAPAWWLLKKKTTMYHTGQIDARAVRPLTSFMMSPLTPGATLRKLEPVFRDIKSYLLTLEPPAYPFSIDRGLAERGQELFESRCARCHGTYGPSGTYPNKIVPLDVIGTDAILVRGISPKVEEHFRQSWFAQEPGPDGRPYPLRYNQGYQAPPLDGVWATAPYFHNGSVPTLHDVLDSTGRPTVFTRSFRTNREDFDTVRVGWKVTRLRPEDVRPQDAAERRLYDTRRPGRSNGGHTFGDSFTESERRAVIEYLKTL